MSTFSSELRSAREAKNITLFDIAKKTRISIKYLAAIEQGTFDVLPQTYIRAFLKSYAEAVGLNAVEVLKKYDINVVAKYSSSKEPQSHAHAITDKNFHMLDPKQAEHDLKEQTKTRKTIYATLALLAGILLVLYITDTLTFGRAPKQVQETPFQEIVHEQEKLSTPPPGNAPNAAESTKTLPVIPVRPDSLILRAVATDSAWLTIVRDDKRPRSGYVLGGSKREWKAKDSFLISVSNGGVISFSLNDKSLGTLGRKGRAVRNYRITVDSLLIRLK